MDESWMPNYSASPSTSCSKPTISRSFSQKSSSSSKHQPLPRSFSLKNTSTSSSSYYNAGNPNSSLYRSSSLKGSSSRSGSHKGSSGSGSNVTRSKYSSLAKEQKARFYIIRRCIAMLVCWHKHGDS